MLAFPVPSVTLYPIADADAAELLRFETENRAFFERSIAGFGDDFYNLRTVVQVIADLTEAWQNDEAYYYLIRNAAGELVGRVSLFGVRRGPAQTAEIGYRVAERHSGKGYAQAAVAQAVRDAFEVYGLHRLEAATSPKNVASQIVLLKNGFEFWGRARRSYRLNGVWEDTVMFERHAGGV